MKKLQYFAGKIHANLLVDLCTFLPTFHRTLDRPSFVQLTEKSTNDYYYNIIDCFIESEKERNQYVISVSWQ